VSREIVDKVTSGAAYGHIVKIGKYEAVWPLTLKIHSSLPDTKQLSFRDGDRDAPEWEWDVTLHANREGGEQERLLTCDGEKRRKKDTVSVRVTTHSKEENLVLEVKIE
jgi:hypothetical protein